eukprot:g6152.t1
MQWKREKIIPNSDEYNGAGNSSLQYIFPPRAEFATIAYNGGVYVIAGANNKQFYNDVWVMNFYNPNQFDLVTGGGRKAKNIFSPRYSHQAVLHKDEIYIMGGFTNEPVGQLLCDVWKMQDNGRSWKRLTAEAWDKKSRIE